MLLAEPSVTLTAPPWPPAEPSPPSDTRPPEALALPPPPPTDWANTPRASCPCVQIVAPLVTVAVPPLLPVPASPAERENAAGATRRATVAADRLDEDSV